MADKDFKVKNKLIVKGISSAGPLTIDASGNVDSTSYIPTQYGGTGTTTSPNAGQIPYSSSGTNYAPTDLSSLTISSSGGSTITASSASTKGLIIKGAASQTAKLQEWENSSGLTVASMDVSGKLIVPTLRGPAGGVITLGTDGQPYSLSISNTQFDSYGPVPWRPYNTSMVGFIIKGLASQTEDLQQWQDSSSSVLAALKSSGTLVIGGTFAINSTFGITLSNKSLAAYYSGNNTSYQAAFNFTRGNTTGAWMNIGTTGDAANGLASIDIRDGSNVKLFSVGYTGNTSVLLNSASSVGLIVKGAASQTANLQEWQNSSGYADTSINSTGRLSVRTTLADAALNVGAPSAATVGAIIRGASSQTANLTEWQNSAGQIRLAVSSYGTLNSYTEAIFNNTLNGTGTALLVKTNNAGGKPLVVQGAASQTADLQQWQDSSGNTLGMMNAYGTLTAQNRMYAGWAAFGSGFGTGASASNVVLIAKGSASQTADLQQWQNSSGTVLASISAAGNLTVQDLTVNGTTTTINSTTLTVDDKNIELASVASPTDTTADGAGITIKGATDKTFNWVQSTGAFTSSEPISTPALSVSGNSVSSNITLAAGKRYFVDTTSARTLTLPASPSLGDEIKIFDASGTAATNNITVARNGNKINGITDDAIIDVNQSSSVFVYTGATVGWRFD